MSSQTSTDIAELAKALSAAQGEFGAVPKTAENPFFRAAYAPLPAVVKEATPILSKHGLSVSQLLGYDGINNVDTLTTRLMHGSGQWIESTMRLYLVKADSQSLGSAVTYSRRYSYMAILGLVADVDDDGNAASSRGKPAQATAETTKRAAPKAAAAPVSGEPSTKKLFAMLNGRKDIDDRHKWATGVLGREVVTFTGLGADDIATLEQWFKGNPAPKNNETQYEPGQEPF